MNPILVLQQAKRDAVYRCITPTFVVEVASLIEIFEERFVRLRAKEIEIGDFEVRPDLKNEEIS